MCPVCNGPATFGSTTLTSSGGYNIFIAKVSGSTGAFEWAVQAGGSGELFLGMLDLRNAKQRKRADDQKQLQNLCSRLQSARRRVLHAAKAGESVRRFVPIKQDEQKMKDGPRPAKVGRLDASSPFVYYPAG